MIFKVILKVVLTFPAQLYKLGIVALAKFLRLSKFVDILFEIIFKSFNLVDEQGVLDGLPSFGYFECGIGYLFIDYFSLFLSLDVVVGLFFAGEGGDDIIDIHFERVGIFLLAVEVLLVFLEVLEEGEEGLGRRPEGGGAAP